MTYVKAVLFFFLLGCIHTWATVLHLDIKNSECKALKDCPHINKLLQTKTNDYGVLTLLTLVHCYYSNRQIYVRCLDPSKVEDFMKRADTVPNYDICGLESLAPKISGGNQTALDAYPWIALLKYRTSRGVTIYGCHGNLINRRYILTAAHCVHQEQLLKKNFTNIHSVVLGEYDTASDRDCMGADCVENQTKELLVESTVVHPEYNVATFHNDIALVRMKSEVEYDEFIKPVCLPPIQLKLLVNETFYIAGWGNTEENVMNTIKVEAKFRLNEPESCRASNLELTQRQYCVRSTHFAKTCPGDSGGPLMKRVKLKDSVHLFLIGVDSLGIDCRSFNRHFAIYTKVSPYVDWILTSIET